ncbi:MAG: PAS domain S-box protein [Burkholderiaceae bacterium]
MAVSDEPDSSGLSSEARFALLVDSVQDYAIFLLDVDGRVRTWNAGAQRIKGWCADEIIGRSFETFYPPEALDTGWPREALRRAAADGRFEDHGWRIRKDGSRMWAHVVITALRGPDGALLGFGKVTRDRTELKQQEEALRQSEEQFRLLVEAVKDYALFMLDPEGRIRTWNAGAVAIHGYTASEVLGQHFSCVYTAEDRHAGVPERLLARARAAGRAEAQGWRRRKDGSLFWADVVLTQATDAHGKLIGFTKVTRDLSEQRRLGELEQAGRRMREFLAMLSHELRNPLAPIRNAVSVLQMQPELPSVVERARDILARQAGLMTRLVDDLLEVGRIVNGKILLHSEAIDYRDVVKTSVEAAEPLIRERRHRLDVALPDHAVPVWGDAARLAQALQNLLNNAARYTPEEGWIRVTVSRDGSDVLTQVIDNGVGVDAGAHERIFELFVQESERGGSGNGGLGIGLSLARTLVEQHGGSLTVHSEGRGRGSTFTMRLPVDGGARDAASDDPAAAGVQAAGVSSPLSVLVVDDNRDSADTMVELLASLGHSAEAVYCGEEALRIARLRRPRLMLLDLNLPDLDGFAVLRRLRGTGGSEAGIGEGEAGIGGGIGGSSSGPGAENALPGTLIAAMTGYGQRADREQALQSGFDEHLTKPVDLARLRRLLEASRLEGPGPDAAA